MGKITKRKGVKLFLLILVGLAIFSWPTHFAYAGWLNMGVSDLAVTFISWIQGLVLGLLGTFLYWAVRLLAYFLTYQESFFKNIVVVNETWRVMRDFSNMFFILMLIIISFATIFQISKYNWKGLMARLIVIALLINFSLVICSYVIRASHIVSNVMLSSIGGDEKGIADNLGAALQMNKLIGDGKKANSSISAGVSASNVTSGNISRTAFDAILSTIMAIIVVFIALLAIISAAAFSLVRIPILWALMIVSPLAWTASILPGTKKMYEMWFKEFVGWTIFLPVYLFTLFLSLIILKARNSISAVVQAPNSGADPFGGFISFAFQDIFYYVLCILAIVYGLKYAKSFSFGGSSAAGKFFDEKISSKVNQWGRDRTYATAIKKGWDEKSKEFKDKGYGFGRFRVGGERSERLREAKVAPIFGQNVQRNMQKEVLKDGNKEYEDINKQFEEGRITTQQVIDRSRSINPATAEGYGYRKLAAELQKLTRADFVDNLRAFRNNPVLGADYVKHAREKGKLADIDNTDLIGMATASGGYTDMRDQIQIRKELFKHIAATPKAANNNALDDARFADAVDNVFGGATSQEGKEFLENIQAVNAGLVFRYKQGNNTLDDPAEFWSKIASNADQVGKQSATVWNTDEFRQALFNAIIKRAAGKTRNDFVNAIRTSIATNVTNNDNSLRMSIFLSACLTSANRSNIGDPPPPFTNLTI